MDRRKLGGQGVDQAVSPDAVAGTRYAERDMALLGH